MRICIICPSLGNAGGKAFVGGHENNVVRLGQALARRGHHITILTTPHLHSTHLEAHTGLEWAEVHSLKIKGTYPSLQWGAGFLLAVLRKLRELRSSYTFDIIQGHSGYTMLALITGLAGRLLKIPSMHVLYCPILPVQGWHAYQLLSYRYLARLYLSTVTRLGVISKNISLSLENIGIPSRKIVMMPPVIDLDSFKGTISKDEARRELGLENGGPLLLAVGDLTPRRGLHILAPAIKQLLGQFPSLKLLLAVNMPREIYLLGDFPLKKKFRELGIEEHIIPLGIVDNMGLVMAATDIMVAPYTTIAGIVDYPISLLEAMASRRPVLASHIGGIPEIVLTGETGFLVPPEDSQALAAAISSMLKNMPLLDEMGEKGRKLVEERFKLEIRVEETEQLLLDLSRQGKG